MPGDREKIYEALFAGFEKLNNKIYDGVNPKQRRELAAKIEPVGASEDFGTSITRLIKQELTNAEVELGLRQEFIPGETNPQPIEHPSYKDDKIGISVFKLAAARVFKRVESSIESLGIKIEEAKPKSPAKTTPDLTSGIKGVLDREATAEAVKAKAKTIIQEIAPVAAVKVKNTGEAENVGKPEIAATPVIEAKPEESGVIAIKVETPDPVTDAFGPKARELLNQMLQNIKNRRKVTRFN
jgi:hypothetical protein